MHGNQAIKIPTNLLPEKDRKELFKSKEVYVNYNLLEQCEEKIGQYSQAKNVDILEYNGLFQSQCGQLEKSFYEAVRNQYRKKYYEDQKKEFFMPTGEMYHPYNPYLQKYHGEYMRNYQEF